MVSTNSQPLPPGERRGTISFDFEGLFWMECSHFGTLVADEAPGDTGYVPHVPWGEVPEGLAQLQ